MHPVHVHWLFVSLEASNTLNFLALNTLEFLVSKPRTHVRHSLSLALMGALAKSTNHFTNFVSEVYVVIVVMKLCYLRLPSNQIPTTFLEMTVTYVANNYGC